MRYLRLLVLYATCLLFFLHASSAPADGGSWWKSLTGKAGSQLRQASEPLLGASSSTRRSRNVGRVPDAEREAREWQKTLNNVKDLLGPKIVAENEASEAVEALGSNYVNLGRMYAESFSHDAMEIVNQQAKDFAEKGMKDILDRQLPQALERLEDAPSSIELGQAEVNVLVAWEQTSGNLPSSLKDFFELRRKRLEELPRHPFPLEINSLYSKTLNMLKAYNRGRQKTPFSYEGYQQAVGLLTEESKTFFQISQNLENIPLSEQFVNYALHERDDAPIRQLKEFLVTSAYERKFFLAILKWRYNLLAKHHPELFGEYTQGPGQPSSSYATATSNRR
ncbi:hypothetical protein ACQY0O_004833 [Thecaphora frezii]